MMRQPLEDGKLTISCAAAFLTYPARCTLFVAMQSLTTANATWSVLTDCRRVAGTRELVGKFGQALLSFLILRQTSRFRGFHPLARNGSAGRAHGRRWRKGFQGERVSRREEEER
jgi:magnesium chelatase subunit ChlI-like protein